MMMRKISWMVLLLGMGLGAQAEVKQPPLDFTIHQEYTSTRALGMGNAFTAVADDHSGLFYNPAALAFREDGQLRMFVRAGVSQGYRDLYDNLQTASKEGSEQDQATKITSLLEESYGENLYSRVPTLGLVWVRPNWGLAIIPVDLSIDMTVHRQITPALNVSAYGDTTIAYGRAKKVHWFGEGHELSIGANLKAIHRIYYGESLGVAQLASDAQIVNKENAGEGMTLDMDLGSMWVPPWDASLFHYVKPRFAAVVRNTFDYGFPMQFHVISKDAPQPPKLQRRLDLGSNWDLPNVWVFDPHFAFDIRDIMHENWTFKKGVHAGVELYWKMFSWWKGYWSVGVNQMYPTFGFGARLAWFQLDLATWGEEAGTDKDPIQSRRYIVEMSLDF